MRVDQFHLSPGLVHVSAALGILTVIAALTFFLVSSPVMNRSRGELNDEESEQENRFLLATLHVTSVICSLVGLFFSNFVSHYLLLF